MEMQINIETKPINKNVMYTCNYGKIFKQSDIINDISNITWYLQVKAQFVRIYLLKFVSGGYNGRTYCIRDIWA